MNNGKMKKISINVNGEDYNLEVDIRESLLDVLRNKLISNWSEERMFCWRMWCLYCINR